MADSAGYLGLTRKKESNAGMWHKLLGQDVARQLIDEAYRDAALMRSAQLVRKENNVARLNCS